MLSVEGFRTSFPAFADPAVYPDVRVDFWISMAVDLLPQNRWRKLYERGVYLYTAHCLTLETQSMSEAGGGAGVGVVTSESESIDGLSYSQSYDTSAYSSDGQMGTTVYGQMYLDLARKVGAGGVQL